jgi:hypothetical protein
MTAPNRGRNPQAQPVGSSQKSQASSTNRFEALSAEETNDTEPAQPWVQIPFRPLKRHQRWASDEDLPVIPPPATMAQKVPSTAQPQLVAPQSSSNGLPMCPKRTLNTSSASPHKSATPSGTLVAGTAQPQQAGHTHSGQIPTGSQSSNTLQSQGGVATAQETTPEQLQAWRAAGRPTCKCGKGHPPPCSPEKVAESLARDAERKLIAEQNAARHAPKKRLVNRSQIVPPPVWGGSPGAAAWPALQAPSTALATRPAAPAQVVTQLPYYPQPAGQVATQLPSYHQPGAPLGNRDQFMAMLPSLFATLPLHYRMGYFAAIHDGTVDQFLDQFRSGPMSSNATKQHSTINAAAPGNGNQAPAPLSTTDTQSVNAHIPEGSRPSGDVKGKQPRSQ